MNLYWQAHCLVGLALRAVEPLRGVRSLTLVQRRSEPAQQPQLHAPPGPPIIVGEPTSLRPKSGPKCLQKIGHFDGQMSEKKLGSAAFGGRLSAYSMWVQNGKKMSVPCEVGCVYNKICMERVGWTVRNSGKCTLHRTSCRTPSMTTETFGLRYISL